MKSHFTLPVLLSLAALALHLFPDAATFLEFNRSALAHGEYWRFFTGHLVHFNTSHLMWDVLTLLLLSALLPALSLRRQLWLYGGSAALISAGVWLFVPQLETYRGLSGLDCALFGAIVTHFLRQAYRKRDYPLLIAALLAGLGFTGKCGWEIQQGSAFFAHSAGDFVPVPLAHLLGAVWGMISMAVECLPVELRCVFKPRDSWASATERKRHQSLARAQTAPASGLPTAAGLVKRRRLKTRPNLSISYLKHPDPFHRGHRG